MKFSWPAILIITLLLTGCGYSIPGSAGLDPEDRKAIYLELWQNKTSEMGYQISIQHALVNWLKKSGRMDLTRNRKEADLIISGTINSAYYPSLSYGDFERAVEVRAEVTCSYQIVDQKTGKAILTRNNVTGREAFATSDQAIIYEENKKLALIEIADDLAEGIYISLSHRLNP